MPEMTLQSARVGAGRGAGVRGAAFRRWAGAALVALSAASALAQASPAALAVLELDRAAAGGGQWWRLVTGSFVHCSWPHLLADMGALVLACWLGRARAREAAWVVVLSAAAVGLGVQVLGGSVATYRGASGVAHAVTAWLLLRAALDARGAVRGAWAAGLAAMVIKSAIEVATARPLLCTSLPAGVAVVGAAHLAGIAAGAAVALAGWAGGRAG